MNTQALPLKGVSAIERLSLGCHQRARAILVLSGTKPATLVDLFPWNNTVPRLLQFELAQSGLAVGEAPVPNESKALARFAISLDPKKAEALARGFGTMNDEEIGILLGYPKSAIDAFVFGARLPSSAEPDDIARSPFNFAHSIDRYEEEYSIVRAQNEELRALSPKVFLECFSSRH